MTSVEQTSASDLAPGAEAEPRTQWQLFRRRFFRHRAAMVGLTVLVLLMVACFGASWVAFYSKDWHLFAVGAQGPSKMHWFGLDGNGYDELTQILYAGQLSLKIGLAVALISTLIGTTIGSLAGYYGSVWDQFLSRFTDLFLIVPQLAVLAIATKKFSQSNSFLFWKFGEKAFGIYRVDKDLVIIVVLALLGWTYVARTVRGQVLSIKEKEFVEAARAAGASDRRVIVRHILPNCVGVIMVNLTLSIAGAVIAESTLSFLGFGVQPPQSSWGKMLSDAEGYVGTPNVHLLYFPGLMLLLTVLAVNFLGDGLRDALDPKLGEH